MQRLTLVTGYPLVNFLKLLGIGALVFILGGLSACGGSSSSENSPREEAEPVNEPQQEQEEEEKDPEAEPEPDDSLSQTEAFTNPIFQNGADPWLEYYEGNYYLTTTTWSSQLVMRKSPTLAGLANAKPHYIWSDTEADRCCNFWAFEFHRLEGPDGFRWYVMYTAGVEENLDGQRLHVLESAGDDPLGPYEFKNTLMPNRWNIDGTYLEHNDKLYVIWSEWDGPDQSGWIAEMENPWTVVEGTQTLISRPTFQWEMGSDLDGNPGRVNEGQAILKHDGRTFMSFSASSCHGPNYKIGMMELMGNDPLNPEAWHKYSEPFLEAGNGVYGPGHNCFFKSPDGTEDWLVYHGNEAASQGCSADRWVRAQPVAWDSDGLPDFGEPAGPDTQVPNPSGEAGPINADIQGVEFDLVNRHSGHCLAIDEAGNAVQQSCDGQSAGWVLDATGNGRYRLARERQVLSGDVSGDKCTESQLSGLTAFGWIQGECQQWELNRMEDGWFELSSEEAVVALQGCASEPGALVGGADDPESPQCQQWRLQPRGEVTIVNENSGRLIEVSGCSSESGANVAQRQLTGTDCQRWRAEHSDNGFYRLHPGHNTQACLSMENASAESGGNLIQSGCDGQNAQWLIEPLGEGTWRFSPRHAPQQALDVDTCALADGANVGQWEWLDNNCQRFRLASTL